jgi:hypothetical protein
VSESLFTVQTPDIANASDGAPGITCGITVKFAVAGTVTAIRLYTTTTVSGAYSVRLDEVTASDDTPAFTALGDADVVGTPAAGQWVTVSLDSPVPVVPTKLYRASYFSGAGRYVATLDAFDGTDFVNGNITAFRDGADPIALGSIRQGVFRIDAAAGYPSTGGNGTNYFADVVFEPDEEDADVANPQHFVLSADTEKVFTLDANFGRIEITQVANPAVVYFNATNTEIGTVAGAVATMNGNQVLPAVLCSKTVLDETAGGVSVVRVRSAGTPTISVRGL